jgi:hypothetical protein
MTMVVVGTLVDITPREGVAVGGVPSVAVQ